ncbi:MAG: hypothetical protein Q9211_000028, partial [Gyalolechia sp. 1 TL-2023]
GKKRLNRVDWMYSGPSAGQAGTTEEMEGYLLGKRRVDGLLKGTETKHLEKAAAEDSFIALQKANTVRDTASKIREDPMLAIKKQEQAAYEALMNDPVKRRLLLKAAGGDSTRMVKERKYRKHRQADDDRDEVRFHSHKPQIDLNLFEVAFTVPPKIPISTSSTKQIPITIPQASTISARTSPSPRRRSPPRGHENGYHKLKASKSWPNGIRRSPPSPKREFNDRAAKLAAMQQNASELDQDRGKRIAAIAEREDAERKADETARARSARYGGRGDFVQGLNRKAGDLDIGERMRRGRQVSLPSLKITFMVDSKDSLENVESKWVGEIAENCQGVKLVLVALKCDLRNLSDDDDDGPDDDPSQRRKEKDMIDYKEGLEVARRIQALRYLECSAKRNRGVNEAFTEAARVALSVKTGTLSRSSKCTIM